MKRTTALILLLALVCAGCRQIARSGTPGPRGPAGPAGRGYEDLVLQPGPDDPWARDTTLDSLHDNQGQQPAMNIGMGKNANTSRGLLFFDISQNRLPAGAVLIDATLTLYPNSPFCSKNSLSAHVYPMLRAWNEKDSTWSQCQLGSFWKNRGGDYIETLPVGGFYVENLAEVNKRVDIHLDTTMVQNWLNGQVNHGLLIKADFEGGSERVVSFLSRDYKLDPTKRPSLKLIYY